MLAQDLDLKPHEISVDRGRATDAPKERRQSEGQFAFHGRLGVVVCNDGRFKFLVVLDIFDELDNRFGTQPMSHGVATRPAFTFLGFRTGASLGIAPISFKLSK
jgi:hypothetical protein